MYTMHMHSLGLDSTSFIAKAGMFSAEDRLCSRVFRVSALNKPYLAVRHLLLLCKPTQRPTASDLDSEDQHFQASPLHGRWAGKLVGVFLR